MLEFPQTRAAGRSGPNTRGASASVCPPRVKTRALFARVYLREMHRRDCARDLHAARWVARQPWVAGTTRSHGLSPKPAGRPQWPRDQAAPILWARPIQSSARSYRSPPEPSVSLRLESAASWAAFRRTEAFSRSGSDPAPRALVQAPISRPSALPRACAKPVLHPDVSAHGMAHSAEA